MFHCLNDFTKKDDIAVVQGIKLSPAKLHNFLAKVKPPAKILHLRVFSFRGGIDSGVTGYLVGVSRVWTSRHMRELW